METDTSPLPPNASSTALLTTVAKTTNPTTMPTIATMTAAMLVPLRLPAWNSPTMPRMKAIGSRIHPTMRAPGMHAKMNPTTAVITAMRPTMFFCFSAVAGAPGKPPAGGAGGMCGGGVVIGNSPSMCRTC
ncbi:hypothetical protein [Tomitella gaofuii]|uniref:hypothetical protein n=1 Tax=Tomitella gaofuii TaxID=2760083 RepID=UPI0020C0A907|nr:hypothetical protein [Tomitella gaofuii]